MNVTHQTIPSPVEAHIFTGETLNAGWLIGWAATSGFPGTINYVPTGAESYIRTENELDRSRGDARADAPPFLAIVLGDAKAQRLDRGGWLVRESETKWSWWSGQQFEARFEVRVPQKGD